MTTTETAAERKILGHLVHPNGEKRLPVLSLMGTDGLLVRGEYVDFETSIGAAIRSGYALEANPGSRLQASWDKTRSERGDPVPQVGADPIPPLR
jgi:hypothetical protein